MAKFKKKRVTEDIASKILGELTSREHLKEGWEILDRNGRPRARTTICYGYRDIRTDLSPKKTSEFRTTDGQVITDKFFWPKELSCEIDLADFYVDENDTFQHPLHGFHIPKLIEATQYPFYNHDRVIAILARFSKNNLILNSKKPDAVVFIERWSHFDDYDTIIYSSPSEAFKIPLTVGTLWTKQLEDKEAHVGKNFVILPFGYCYDEAMEERDKFTTAEWTQLCTKNATKWTQIIQDFLDGREEANNETADPEIDNSRSTNDASTKIEGIVQDINQSVEQTVQDLPIPSLVQWQKKQREALQNRFLSKYHIKVCEELEYILQERKDQNGIQVWRVASPIDRADNNMNLSFFEELIPINGIWYRVTNFIYCTEHYVEFINFLNEATKKHSELQKMLE